MGYFFSFIAGVVATVIANYFSDFLPKKPTKVEPLSPQVEISKVMGFLKHKGNNRVVAEVNCTLLNTGGKDTAIEKMELDIGSDWGSVRGSSIANKVLKMNIPSPHRITARKDFGDYVNINPLLKETSCTLIICCSGIKDEIKHDLILKQP